MNKFGVENTYEALRQKMLQYIKTVYLGQNAVLREACTPELEAPLTISQDPYIEANPAYQVEEGGLLNISPELLSPALRSFFENMIADNHINGTVRKVNILDIKMHVCILEQIRRYTG